MTVNFGRTIPAFAALGYPAANAPAAADTSRFLREILRASGGLIFEKFIRLKTLSCYTVRKVEKIRSTKSQSIAKTQRFMKNPVLFAAAATREKTGLTLQEIAEQTKISKRHLEAVENGDFRKLPGGVYATSYIRQYARAIGFDEFELLAVYHAETGAPQTLPLIAKVQNPSVRGFRPLFQ
jgi:hypothetical protein